MERKKEVIVESLKLPKDSVLGASIVTITGNTDAFVENYRGILEYSEELILLQGKTCQISIIGKRMSIDYYTNEDMKISGYIECIRYHNSY
ncbi:MULTISPECIES: YabP/YqfC family sporulation protein [Kineothrix]|uniref:YabP/YqfC family sporulation protein n=1 Tax=Kineothrix sedimenti TaxID=3123317 RepID=A0ABZ3EQP9_9FIRM|nr:YabP/YqfC family sporulation protein [Kineothrix alysoides]